MLGAVLPRSTPSEDAASDSAVMMLSLMEAAASQVDCADVDQSRNLGYVPRLANVAPALASGDRSYHVGGAGAVVTMPQHGELRPTHLPRVRAAAV